MEEIASEYSSRCKYNEKEAMDSRKRVVLQLKLNIMKKRMLRISVRTLVLGRFFGEMLWTQQRSFGLYEYWANIIIP